MKINRKQFYNFLSLLQLSGLDDFAKVKKLNNEIVIHFKEDDADKNYIQAFGIDISENVSFDYIYYIDMEFDNDIEMISINDINKWISYIKSCKDEMITLELNDGTIIISDSLIYFSIPDQLPTSISSYVLTGEKPILTYSSDMKKYEEINYDKWSNYEFNPEDFLTFLKTGSIISNMNIKIIFNKNKISLEVGDINDEATTRAKIDKITNVKTLNWVHEKEESWSCELGIHSAVSMANLISHLELPQIKFKSYSKNIIIHTTDATFMGKDIYANWIIASAAIKNIEN